MTPLGHLRCFVREITVHHILVVLAWIIAITVYGCMFLHNQEKYKDRDAPRDRRPPQWGSPQR